MTGGDTRAARRYSHALFEAARKAGAIDSVQADVETLAELWASTRQLRQALGSPMVDADGKNRLVQSMFGERLHPLTLAFLRLVIAKRRETILPDVRPEFVRLADAARGLVRARATSAVPLDEAQEAALRAGLERRTGKRVQLSVAVDPAILGGIAVRLEDTVIDGSVRGALERLRERMLAEA